MSDKCKKQGWHNTITRKEDEWTCQDCGATGSSWGQIDKYDEMAGSIFYEDWETEERLIEEKIIPLLRQLVADTREEDAKILDDMAAQVSSKRPRDQGWIHACLSGANRIREQK